MTAEEVLVVVLGKIKNQDRLRLERVESLPEVGYTNYLYFLKNNEGYEMYIYDGEWIDLGKAEINLDGYATLDQLITVRNLIYVETQNRNESVRQLTNSINAESERAQGVEETLSTAINEETVRAIDVENGIVQSIGLVQENLEGEIDALDVCIEQQTYNEGRGGYRKYRNGILEQWGISTSAISSYPYEHNLHTPFSSTNFVIFVTPREQGNFFSYAYPSSVSKFSCRIQSRDSQDMAVQFQWFARGRWK